MMQQKKFAVNSITQAIATRNRSHLNMACS